MAAFITTRGYLYYKNVSPFGSFLDKRYCTFKIYFFENFFHTITAKERKKVAPSLPQYQLHSNCKPFSLHKIVGWYNHHNITPFVVQYDHLSSGYSGEDDNDDYDERLAEQLEDKLFHPAAAAGRGRQSNPVSTMSDYRRHDFYVCVSAIGTLVDIIWCKGDTEYMGALCRVLLCHYYVDSLYTIL